jgi:Uma2 family endonuclease
MTPRELTTPVVAEPTWEIAHLFPAQGHWTEHEYLSLDTNRLVEFIQGRVEVLPMPTQSHQTILFYLARMLAQYAERRSLGTVLPAGIRVQTVSGAYREPDIVFMLAEHNNRCMEEYWLGADLVMEVVSPDDPNRDLVDKRREYAQAGISEYWIIQPKVKKITVLRLAGTEYVVHGVFSPGQIATSALLSRFKVQVDRVFSV